MIYQVANLRTTRDKGGLPVFRGSHVTERIPVGQRIEIARTFRRDGDLWGELWDTRTVVLESPVGTFWALPVADEQEPLGRLLSALPRFRGWTYGYPSGLPKGTPGRHGLGHTERVDCITFTAGLAGYVCGGAVWCDRDAMILAKERAAQSWWATLEHLVDIGHARWVTDLSEVDEEDVVMFQGARDRDGDGEFDEGETGHSGIVVGPPVGGLIRLLESNPSDGPRWTGHGRVKTANLPPRSFALDDLLARYSDIRFVVLR